MFDYRNMLFPLGGIVAGGSQPPLKAYMRSWLIGTNDDGSIDDKLTLVTPEPVTKHVNCIVSTAPTALHITNGNLYAVTNEGTAYVIGAFAQYIIFGVGTIINIRYDGELVYPCQEGAGLPLNISNIDSVCTELLASKTWGFTDDVGSRNLLEGFSFTETAMVFQPEINPTTHICEFPYYDEPGDTFVNWGDGTATEPISDSGAFVTSHTYPDSDEDKYTARIMFSATVVRQGTALTGIRKILNMGSLYIVDSFSKTSPSMTHFTLGDFDSTKVYNLTALLRSNRNLVSADFSAPQKIKVSAVSDLVASASIIEFDARDIDFSECTAFDSMLYGCSSLKRVDFTGCDFSGASILSLFMSNSTLDTDNYSRFLVEIAKTLPPPHPVVYIAGFGFSKYAGQEAIDARAHLESLGWTVQDGGLA